MMTSKPFEREPLPYTREVVHTDGFDRKPNRRERRQAIRNKSKKK